jgi:hypothetical protein
MAPPPSCYAVTGWRRTESGRPATNRGLLQSRCKRALACSRSAASNAMKTLASWGPAPNLNVIAVGAGERIVSVDSRDAEQDRDRASCPVCGTQSSSRHSSYMRRPQAYMTDRQVL